MTRCLVVVMVTLCCAAPAAAHVDPNRPTHRMVHVAQGVFGAGKCTVGTMNIPIHFVRGLWWRTGMIGFFVRRGWDDCRVRVDRTWWLVAPWDARCRLLGHELGHAAGRRHARGGIMRVPLARAWPPCDR